MLRHYHELLLLLKNVAITHYNIILLAMYNLLLVYEKFFADKFVYPKMLATFDFNSRSQKLRKVYRIDTHSIHIDWLDTHLLPAIKLLLFSRHCGTVFDQYCIVTN